MSWEALAASWPGDAPPAALAEQLAELYEAGRRRWAELPELAREDFVAHLAVHTPPDVDPAGHLASLVIEDLYLACACLTGVPGAIEALDATLLSRVPGYVAHIDRSPAFTQEIQQLVRERLLVRRPEGPPRLAAYSGRGSLASWLRVTAVRIALNQRAQPHEGRRADGDVVDELASDGSPELELLRAQHGAALTGAVERALAGLPAEQRVILRMYFSSAQSTEQIAGILRVNRSTAARRLVAARQAVFDETKRLLRSQLGLTSDEFVSLARALHDGLNLTLGGLLSRPPA